MLGIEVAVGRAHGAGVCAKAYWLGPSRVFVL